MDWGLASLRGAHVKVEGWPVLVRTGKWRRCEWGAGHWQVVVWEAPLREATWGRRAWCLPRPEAEPSTLGAALRALSGALRATQSAR